MIPQSNPFGLSASLKPAGRDRHGEYWEKNQINNAVFKMVETDKQEFIKDRTKKMKDNYKEATDILDETKQLFSNSLGALVRAEQDLAEQAKKVSGSVRKSANELMSGLEKVQKTANFTSLEKQVELLERAATALQSLAELEKTGKLEKLLAAIK